MATLLALVSYFGSKNIPKPKVYNSNNRGSGLDPGSQLTTAQNVEGAKHSHQFTKESAKEDRTNDTGWPTSLAPTIQMRCLSQPLMIQLSQKGPVD
jgi:hypothetical protein